jgi:flagellar hook-associated protein 3 FlgL
MRIPDLNNSDTLLANLQRLSSRQSGLQNQVATGQRITRPSDDPGATGRVLEMQAEKQRLQQYARNADRSLEINQTTYSAITELKDISNRAGEMAVLGLGALDPVANQSYATELNQLIEHGLQMVNSSFSGEHLFGGVKTDAPPFTATRDANGQITGVTYAGATSAAEFHVGDGASISPYNSPASNAELGTFLNNHVAMRDALQSGSSAAVEAAQPGILASEDDILDAVTTLAATQTRLEGDQVQNEARFSELERLTSKETDADMSETIVRLTQTQTAYQAALQVGAQVMRVSLLDYIR